VLNDISFDIGEVEFLVLMGPSGSGKTTLLRASTVERLIDSVTITDDYGIWWSYIPHFIRTPGYVYAYSFGDLLVRVFYEGSRWESWIKRPESPSSSSTARRFPRATEASRTFSGSVSRSTWGLINCRRLVVKKIGILFGMPIGAIAGYYRGKVDEVIMRANDAFLAIPPILMALVIVAILGRG
jgi:ABC-type dipeptide/oligopeptide/nickel transport system ATPase component